MNPLTLQTPFLGDSDDSIKLPVGREATQVLAGYRTHVNFRNCLSPRDFTYLRKGYLDQETNVGVQDILGLSGDFIVCIPHSNTSYSVIVGDVAGHDEGAINQSIEIQKFLTTHAFTNKAKNMSLLEAITTLQEQFKNPKQRGFELSWVKVDSEKKELESYSSGALKPFIIRRNGTITREVNHLYPFPLGPSYDNFYIPTDNKTTPYKAGDILIQITDGVADSIVKKNEPGRERVILNILTNHLEGETRLSVIASEILTKIKKPEDDLSLSAIRLK